MENIRNLSLTLIRVNPSTSVPFLLTLTSVEGKNCPRKSWLRNLFHLSLTFYWIVHWNWGRLPQKIGFYSYTFAVIAFWSWAMSTFCSHFQVIYGQMKTPRFVFFQQNVKNVVKPKSNPYFSWTPLKYKSNHWSLKGC